MSSRIITLNKPGLYVAEHNSTGKQFLVSIGGELPMLRVINIINLSDFVSGFYADNKDKQNYKMTWKHILIHILILLFKLN